MMLEIYPQHQVRLFFTFQNMIQMEHLKHTIAYCTSILFLSSTFLFGACFVGLFIQNPPFTWSSLPDYVQYCLSYDQSLKHIAQGSMILLSISLLVMLA